MKLVKYVCFSMTLGRLLQSFSSTRFLDFLCRIYLFIISLSNISAIVKRKISPVSFSYSQVSDKSLNLPENLRNLPLKMNRTEFQSYVFPVIVSLASYHSYLEPGQQQRCIKCLEYGLASKCASQCVMALTTCTLEMRDAMHKLLPEVLLNLSKISATVVIAIPILEFLSSKHSSRQIYD